MSGDTQAVLATDKVRFQGQEVAAVIAEDPYIGEGRARADRRRLRAARRGRDAAGGRRRRRARDPRREGGPDEQPHLPLGVGRQGGDRPGVRRGRRRRDARHPLPALAPRAARDVRVRRRRRPGHGPGDDLHDVAGAARDPDRVRAGRRAAGGEHPDHLARPRRRVRQQGAGLPRLRRGDGRVAVARPPGEVDRGPHGEPHLHRVRPRLPHDGRDGAQGRRHDARAAYLAPRRRGRLPRRRPALEVQGRAVPHRDRVLRPAGGPRVGRRLLHEQGARRRRVPVLVPRDRGLVPDRAPGPERRVRARHGPRRHPEEELHPQGPVPVRVGHRVRLRLRRLPRRDGLGARDDRLRRAPQGAGGEARPRASCGASGSRRSPRSSARARTRTTTSWV